jgi:hypothetical protein
VGGSKAGNDTGREIASRQLHSSLPGGRASSSALLAVGDPQGGANRVRTYGLSVSE